jgi:hypothetical protein
VGEGSLMSLGGSHENPHRAGFLSKKLFLFLRVPSSVVE